MIRSSRVMTEQSHAIVYGLLAGIAILTAILFMMSLRYRAAVRAAVVERERLRRNVYLLLDATAVGIVATDNAERCTFVNRAAAETLGRGAEDLIGVPIGTLLVTRGP